MSDQIAYQSTIVHLPTESVRINKGDVIPPELLPYVTNPHVLLPPPPEDDPRPAAYVPRTASETPQPTLDGGGDGGAEPAPELDDVDEAPLAVLPDQLPAVLDALDQMSDDDLREFAEVSGIDLGRLTATTSIRGRIEEALRGRAEAATTTEGA